VRQDWRSVVRWSGKTFTLLVYIRKITNGKRKAGRDNTAVRALWGEWSLGGGRYNGIVAKRGGSGRTLGWEAERTVVPKLLGGNETGVGAVVDGSESEEKRRNWTELFVAMS